MNTQRGFTILELMTVVALTAILLTVGVPSFRTLMFNNRITSQINQFSSSLALARSEAVKTNAQVVVCPSANGTTCATGVDWDTGWITFVNRNDTSADPPQVEPGGGDPCAAGSTFDCVLSYVPALTPAEQTLRKSTAGDYITYNGLGASNEATQFVLCDSRGASSAKAVVVSTTGRVSIRTENTDGSALSCTP